MLSSGLPFSMILGTFFDSFLQNCLKGSRARPKMSKRHQNEIPRSPKWRPGVPNWSPKVPQSTKKTQKCTPRCKNVGAGATMKPQVTHSAKKKPRGHPKWSQGAKKTRTNHPRPGARRRRRRSAAPRQEVAGRAKYVILILSKLGGEASLPLLAPPLPPTLAPLPPLTEAKRVIFRA